MSGGVGDADDALWRPVLDGRVWEASVRSAVGFPLRTTAVELRGGGLCVVSPTLRIDPAPIVEHAGRVRFLLAPNHYHHLGVSAWLVACPGSVAVCSRVARGRLARRVDAPWSDLEDLVAALPEDASVLVPEGTRNGEVWLRVARTWIVTDAFFHLATMPSGLLGAFCWLTQTAPGLRIGQTWKYLALKDRRRYAAWLLERLEKDPPDTLVVAHGDILRGDDLGSRLEDVARARLT